MSAYTEEATIAYKKGAKGVIYTKGVVKRLDNTVSLCFNVFEGHYEGPTEVEEVFPWEVSYKTISGNRYQVTCHRQFKAEGTLVEATWNGLLVIEDGYLPAECALIFSQEAFSWENPTKDGQALYSETLRLKTRWS
ncbi:hypothetical protein [Meiothermus rufus]|uniref:hypothetical protein n=1 Tax=Meiothermus rufus TaxID=604332 RepID=UPI000483003F|nr:hypothetical protein [Meiothermus rufus]